MRPDSAAPMRFLPKTTRALATLAWMALCVVGLGLQQLLVVCHAQDGQVHLEFAHDPSACCAHEHAATPTTSHLAQTHAADGAGLASEAPGSGGRERSERAPDCHHEPLAIGITLLPQPASTAVPPAQACGEVNAPTSLPTPSITVPGDHAPATGPPRLVAHLRQLAATRLLL